MKKILTLFTALMVMGSMMVVQATDYYVAGIDGWDVANSNWKMSGSGTIYSKTASALTAGNYEFKITQGSWSSCWGAGAIDNTQSNVTLGGTDNVTFTLSTTSDVTFYFDAGSTKKIYVQAEPVVVPSYTFPQGTKIYYDFTSYEADGVNLYAPGSTWWETGISNVIEVTLTSAWELTAATNLFQSAASGWSPVKCTTLPEDGHNMIVSTNGSTYTWGTYVPIAPTPDTYTVVGEVPGLNWDQEATTNDMTEDNGAYTLTLTDVELAANTPYNYKMVKNHSWTVAYPQNGNANFQVTTAGIYDVTFTLNLSASPEYSVTPTLKQATVVIPAVKMGGTFADGSTWGDTQDFTLASNNESASLTLENLPAGDYEFKVIVGSSYLGNGYTYHRDYTGAESIGDGDNMKLEADVAGAYTFTWTYATNALSITFPDEPTPEMVEVKFFAPRTEDNPWEHVYAYSSKKSRKFLGDWPGTEITSTKDAGWYSVNVRKGSDLIFTDNAGMQTNNIENIQADVCYVPNTIDYEASPKLVTVATKADCKVNYYVAGSKELFGGTIDFAVNVALDDNNQVVLHDVDPGTYKFKINIGNWFWALGGNTHLSSEEGCGTIATNVGVGDVGFAIATKQDITITYNPSTQKICLGAETVKTPGEVTADDMNVKVGETKQIKYWKNNTEGYGATYEVLSGEEYIQIYNGFAVGVKAGTATVRITIAETANYTAASDEFTVTVAASSDPSIDPIAPIGGKFIINAKGDTAIFSRGNLQYQQSSNTWRCAPNQYDWMGMSNVQMGKADYAGWVDLFCWSIGAENNYGATSNYQTATYVNKSFVDWGELFAGGEDEWSTLSKDELNYILNSRPGANNKWGIAMIGDTLGMVLLPDVWTTAAPTGVTFVAGNSSLPTTELWRDEDCIQDIAPEEIEAKGYQYRLNRENLPANKFTLQQWAELETAGAVFLPFAGRRTGGVGNYLDYSEATHPNTQCQLYYENYQGTYWTSTMYNASKGQPYYLYTFKYSKSGSEEFYDWGKGVLWSENGRFGQSVRLVKRIPNAWTEVRTGVTAGNYYTICNPKAMTEVRGASLWSFTGKDANFAYIVQENAPFEAGKPYILYATASTVEAKLDGTPVTVAGENNGLHGTFVNLTQEAFDAPGAQIYLVIGNELRLVTGQSNNTLPAYRAYAELSEIPDGTPAPMPGRQVRSMALPKNTPTGIDQITNDQLPMTNKVIIDGQLFILRGEKMYNANGILVK